MLVRRVRGAGQRQRFPLPTIQADAPRAISDFGEIGLLDLIVKSGIAEAINSLPANFCSSTRTRARARVMGCYSESEKALGRDRNAFHRRRCASAIRARPAFVLGPVDIPPWNRQRRFPGTTLMMHGAPARVLAQHLGRNLRFKGNPRCDRPRSNILRHQRRSRQVTSEHACPVLGQRTIMFIS